jgi:predicted kinase
MEGFFCRPGKKSNKGGLLFWTLHTDANIVFVECVLKEDIIKERLLKREAGYSVSDARYHHYEEFKKRFEPLNELSDVMHIRVDTGKPLEDCMEQVLAKTTPLMARKP